MVHFCIQFIQVMFAMYLELLKLPIFSSLPFAIRLNLRHPQPSLFLFGLSPLCCFSTLVNYYFEAFSSLKVILRFCKKYCDIAPLMSTVHSIFQLFFRRGSFGMLPLHMASLGGFTDCCRKLIAYGKCRM